MWFTLFCIFYVIILDDDCKFHIFLCLLLDKDALPAHFGIVTPAEAMGHVLINRLQKAGISFEVK